MASYIALVRKDVDSDYGVEFPDFPGCITAGKTLQEAQKNAMQALDAHIQFMIAEGDEVPLPRRYHKVIEGAWATMMIVGTRRDIFFVCLGEWFAWGSNS